MTTRPRNVGSALAVILLLSGVLARGADDPDRRPPVEDPDVEQAQFVRPVAPQPVPVGRGLPTLPPTPAVQLVVLVPQDVAPKTEITYTVRVTNTTAADAHRVEVRMPVPEGTQYVKAEPKADGNNGKPPQPPTEYTWKFKTLGGNASQSIQVTVKPKEETREVSARAYVSFEHGQQVTTRIAAPKLKVRTETPKQAVVGGPIPVRVTITNDGRVPIQEVKLRANIPQGFEFDRDAGGEKTKDPHQRVWDVGTLPAGGSRQVAYQVVAREVRELVVQSAVDGSHQTQVVDESKTAVKEAKIKVELRGDGTVDTGQDAKYEAFVTNTGSLPLTNVRVTALVPEGCKVTSMTNGGREARDQITWVIPKMAAEDRPYSVRWRLTSIETGRKTVRAAAVAGQGVESSQHVETVFKGAAALHWETSFDQATVPVDRSGMLTITVKNTGSEPARNVRIEVGLPKEVSLIRATPGGAQKLAKVVFAPLDIPAGKVVEYSVEFRGEQPGSAHFPASLFADVLGADPLRTNKYVEVIRR